MFFVEYTKKKKQLGRRKSNGRANGLHFLPKTNQTGEEERETFSGRLQGRVSPSGRKTLNTARQTVCLCLCRRKYHGGGGDTWEGGKASGPAPPSELEREPN